MNERFHELCKSNGVPKQKVERRRKEASLAVKKQINRDACDQAPCPFSFISVRDTVTPETPWLPVCILPGFSNARTFM